MWSFGKMFSPAEFSVFVTHWFKCRESSTCFVLLSLVVFHQASAFSSFRKVRPVKASLKLNTFSSVFSLLGAAGRQQVILLQYLGYKIEHFNELMHSYCAVISRCQTRSLKSFIVKCYMWAACKYYFFLLTK